MNAKDLILKMRRRRHELGMTQGKLASRIGRSGPYLSLIEIGDREIKLADFVKACDALGLTVTVAKKEEARPDSPWNPSGGEPQ